LSFLAGCALLALDLGLLAAMIAAMGRHRPADRAAWLAAALGLHAAMLVSGAAWLCGRPWIAKGPLALGLLATFTFFLAAQVLRLQIQETRARSPRSPGTPR